MDLRLVSEMCDASSPLKLDMKSNKKVMKTNNFCSIDKLLGNADGGSNSGPESKGGTDLPSNPFAVVGMRMPSVLELVNGLHQHKAAAAAFRGELQKS